MNLTTLLQSIPARIRSWVYAIVSVALVVQTFFGWPGGRIGEGIVSLAGALGLVIAVGNVNRT
jgi:hypothetical protein